MWFLSNVHDQAVAEEKREMSEESVWTMKTRKKDVSLPSKTMKISAVGVLSWPWESTAIKRTPMMLFTIFITCDGVELFKNTRPSNCTDWLAWIGDPVAWKNWRNFNSIYSLPINCWWCVAPNHFSWFSRDRLPPSKSNSLSLTPITMVVLPSQLSWTSPIGVPYAKRGLIMMMLNITLVKAVPVTLVTERIAQTTTAPIVTCPSFAIFVIVDFMAITVLIITAKRIFVKNTEHVLSVMGNTMWWKEKDIPANLLPPPVVKRWSTFIFTSVLFSLM